MAGAGSRGEALMTVLRRLSSLLNDMWGADKVYKVLAYGCKVASGLGGHPPPTWATVTAKVASSITMARYALRFWGTLDAGIGVVDAVAALQCGRGGKADAWLELVQQAAMLVYHPLEHAWWVDAVSDGALLSPPVADATSRASCAAWFVWCVAALVSLWRTAAALRAKLVVVPAVQRGAAQLPAPVAAPPSSAMEAAAAGRRTPSPSPAHSAAVSSPPPVMSTPLPVTAPLCVPAPVPVPIPGWNDGSDAGDGGDGRDRRWARVGDSPPQPVPLPPTLPSAAAAAAAAAAATAAHPAALRFLQQRAQGTDDEASPNPRTPLFCTPTAGTGGGRGDVAVGGGGSGSGSGSDSGDDADVTAAPPAPLPPLAPTPAPAPAPAPASSASVLSAADRAAAEEALLHTRLRATALIADTLMAAHWSLPGPGLYLSPTRVGLLGLYSGVVGVYLKWCATK